MTNDDHLEKLLHLEEKTKHHEERLDNHASEIGKIYSMVHNLVVKVAVLAMEHGVWRKLIYGAIGVVLLWVGGKLLKLI